MMKSLLAGVAAIAMVASAAAQTMDDTNNNNGGEYWYECSVIKSGPDKDPGYKVNIVIDVKSDTFIRVVHTTRSGKEYDRSSQYTLTKNGYTDSGANVWIGNLTKNRSIVKAGTLGVIDGKSHYREWVLGKSKAVMDMDSVCHAV